MQQAGMRLAPLFRAILPVRSQRDELGLDLLPDYMTSVRDGGFYDWTYRY